MYIVNSFLFPISVLVLKYELCKEELFIVLSVFDFGY